LYKIQLTCDLLVYYHDKVNILPSVSMESILIFDVQGCMMPTVLRLITHLLLQLYLQCALAPSKCSATVYAVDRCPVYIVL